MFIINCVLIEIWHFKTTTLHRHCVTITHKSGPFVEKQHTLIASPALPAEYICATIQSISSKQNSLMNFTKIPRIIFSTYFQFETIFDAIGENSSCSEHGQTKDTSMYCMYTSMYYNTVVLPLQPSFSHHMPVST